MRNDVDPRGGKRNAREREGTDVLRALSSCLGWKSQAFMMRAFLDLPWSRSVGLKQQIPKESSLSLSMPVQEEAPTVTLG